jgi:hypothetical protein
MARPAQIPRLPPLCTYCALSPPHSTAPQLLSPLCDAPTLGTRLDCVAELLGDEGVYLALAAGLPRLCDLDALLAAVSGVGCRSRSCMLRIAHSSKTSSLPRRLRPANAPCPRPPQFVSTPKVATPRTSRRAVASLIALKHTLETLPSIAGPLAGAANPLLAAIRDNLTAPPLGALRALVDAVLTEDTTWARSPVAARQQECFAVRPGIDGAWARQGAGRRGAMELKVRPPDAYHSTASRTCARPRPSARRVRRLAGRGAHGVHGRDRRHPRAGGGLPQRVDDGEAAAPQAAGRR